MRRLIIKLQSLFASERKPEKATVSFDKLQHWTDLQYKPLLKSTYEQMRKQLITCKDSAKLLALAQKEIVAFQPKNQRVDVHTKILNKKSILLKSIKSLLSLFDDIDKIEDLFAIYQFYKSLEKEIQSMIHIREEVGEILGDHMQKQYSQVIQIVHSLDENVKKSRMILSESVNKNYLRAQKVGQAISEKREKSEYYDQKMALTKSAVLERRTQVEEIRAKIAHIKNDPKYLLEKQSIKNRSGKFSLSFYDLELDKFERQVSELAQAIVSLKEHYHKLLDAKNELNVEGSIQTFKEIMLSSFNIEVELVSEKVE